MRQLILCALIVVSIGSAQATVCSSDVAPAATLLFPFLSFDYDDPIEGANTNLAITNLSSQAQILHFTLWSELGTPVLDFNIVLSGYDVQTLNLRDMLFIGLLPDTGTAGGLVESGEIPEALGPSPVALVDAPQATNEISFRCPVTSTAYPNHARLSDETLESIHSLLGFSMGRFKIHQDCESGETFLSSPDDWYQLRDDGPTWAWATVDVVETCERIFPDTNPSYWTDQLRNDNVLMGDVIWTNNRSRLSEASTAVHIESTSFPELLIHEGAPLSFYRRWSLSAGEGDGREPLPTSWAMRYFGAGDDHIGTKLRVFKLPMTQDSLIDLEVLGDVLIARDCAGYSYYAWDEDENVITTNPWPWTGADPDFSNLLPYVTQEVSIDQFHTPASNGWILFSWPAAVEAGSAGYQTWVDVRYDAFDYYSAGTQAMPVGNANCRPDEVMPFVLP